MSHVVQIKTLVRDSTAIAAACHRLNLPVPGQGTVQLYSGEVKGVLVRLPGWEFPIAIDTVTGDVRYDNYEGQWGEQTQLDRFLQAYTVEKAKLEARKKGHAVSEEQLQDGSIRLQILEGS